MKIAVCIALLVVSMPLIQDASANDGMQDILPPFQVAPMNVGTFQNAVWAAGGAVYTAHVEPAEGTSLGINLRTVIRQGRREAAGDWTWTARTAENRTLDDPWHTVPSIAVDRENFVHVVYNMHNMPWQYSLSRKPNSIDVLDFRGEALSLIQLGAVKYLNQTPFPGLGTAAIPGTQITYPTFFVDRKGDIWVTYRFALKPKRDWSDRIYGCGIARYDTATRSWSAVGGKVPIGPDDAALGGSGNGSADVTAFCSNPGWWANDIRLWFDDANTMHVVWCWSDYITSDDPERRREYHGYARSSDGGQTFTHSDGKAYKLPIDLKSSELVSPTADHYGGTSLTADKAGNPVVAIQRHGEPFRIARLDANTHRWTQPEASPSGASVIINDGKGRLWAFAGGPAIFRSTDQAPFYWSKIYEEDGWDHPKVFYAADEDAFYLRLMKCEETKIPVKRGDSAQSECTVKISRFQAKRP
jgi:hypothetical protein